MPDFGVQRVSGRDLSDALGVVKDLEHLLTPAGGTRRSAWLTPIDEPP